MTRATTACTWLLVALALGIAGAQSRARYIPYGDAKPILEALRADLLPGGLRGKSDRELQAAWPGWVSGRDTEIRARLEQGDEDSIVNFLLFGVSFTRQPRITERDMDAGLAGVREIVQARIGDLAASAASPGGDERIDFVRAIARRKAIDPGTAGGRDALRRYLQDQVARFLADREAIARRAVSAAARAASDPAAAAPEVGTLFSARGLSSDTTIYIDFGIEAALEAIKTNRLLASAAVHRVAIVGPGLDFTDKREGYDFYPPQTLQPFAVIDSLKRLGLAGGDLRVATLDLSPRINRHVAAARERARTGAGYVLQLPRDTSFEWNPLLVKYWEQLGDRIGGPATAAAAPPGVEMRAVRVRPEIVRSIMPADLNIVLQRIEPLAAGERYDLMVATNILVYYDVFELPATPMRSVGFTDVLYERRDAGRDRVFWYQRQ